MARREKRKETVIREVTEVLAEKIRAMEFGERASINPLVTYHYMEQGYEKKHLGFQICYALTKDGGTTYLLKDTDLFEVMDRLGEKLKGDRFLDFSAYEDMVVGLPYNLTFVVRKDSTNRTQ